MSNPASSRTNNFTVLDPDFIKCPFQDYQWMRDEQPVFRDPATGFFVVSRYEDVRRIALDPLSWSSNTAQIYNRTSDIAEEIASTYTERGWLPMDTMATNDPPIHKRYRSLVDRAFTQPRVKAILPIIDDTVDRLADEVIGKGPFEFMSNFALPLTLTMIFSLVGVNSTDFSTFRRWMGSILEGIDPVLSPERERAITRDVIEFQHYLAAAIESYREAPANTILSGLVHAEIDGEPLTMRELIAITTQLLTAGHDTTTSTLGSAVRHLAEHPEQFAALKADPTKLPTFVEEMLRLYAAIQRLFRRALRDVEIAGTVIPEGSIALIQFGAGNRDERKFSEAARCMLDRTNAAQHLTFGQGIHHCIGNQLARAELTSALRALVTRSSGIHLAPGEASVDYHSQLIALSLSRLEVVIDTA